MITPLSIKSVPAELWALAAAVVGFLSWLAKKFLFRSQKPKPEYITRAEFHHELTATRDRIGASYLALADKIDLTHRDLRSTIDHLAATTEHRLDRLESTVARLDERVNSLVH